MNDYAANAYRTVFTTRRTKETEMGKSLVSVCIPAYNESDCVEELARRLTAVMESLPAYDFEIIICENGSRDDTFEKLALVHAADARFKVVRLSRNFNAEGGVTAALAHAHGDCAVIMNADLQDPPEYIPAFLAKWREGYQNVYAIVARRTGESSFRRFFARQYYRLMNSVSDSPAPPNVSDFRLVDRRVYETFLAMPERFRVMRFMWPWMGFRSIGIDTERPARAGGSSNFRFFQTLHGAMRHVFAQSRAAFVLLPIMGFSLSIFAFATLGVELVRAMFFGVPFDGYGTIVALLLILFGLLFVFLWMIAEYVGMIFEQVRMRPTYIVAKTLGLEGRLPAGDHTPAPANEAERTGWAS